MQCCNECINMNGDCGMPAIFDGYKWDFAIDFCSKFEQREETFDEEVNRENVQADWREQ